MSMSSFCSGNSDYKIKKNFYSNKRDTKAKQKNEDTCNNWCKKKTAAELLIEENNLLQIAGDNKSKFTYQEILQISREFSNNI